MTSLVGRLREMYPAVDGLYVGFKPIEGEQGEAGGGSCYDSDSDNEVPKVRSNINT